ncbi:hypothetical protein QFZ58_006216 [Streptomyces sp. B1I3]|nr:hypothetical protein [Streptomyces sp. B1I3]
MDFGPRRPLSGGPGARSAAQRLPHPGAGSARSRSGRRRTAPTPSSVTPGRPVGGHGPVRPARVSAPSPVLRPTGHRMRSGPSPARRAGAEAARTSTRGRRRIRRRCVRRSGHPAAHRAVHGLLVPVPLTGRELVPVRGRAAEHREHGRATATALAGAPRRSRSGGVRQDRRARGRSRTRNGSAARSAAASFRLGQSGAGARHTRTSTCPARRPGSHAVTRSDEPVQGQPSGLGIEARELVRGREMLTVMPTRRTGRSARDSQCRHRA